MTAVELRRVRIASGLSLEYAERGRGPAIVFLHGYSDSWHSFAGILPRLPGDVRGLALTQRGHGGSDRPEVGYRIEDFGADVVAFMDAVGVASAALVGHSMGSLVAQQVASAHPDRVTHLVLAGSGTAFDNPAVRDLDRAVQQLRDPVPREFVSEFQAGSVYRPVPATFMDTAVNESLEMPARVWHEAMASIRAYRAGARLAALTMPTVIVWGDRDEICPRDQQDRLLEGIRGSTLAVYRDTGHSPHWEQPERFVQDLLAFVQAGRAPEPSVLSCAALPPA